MCRQQPAAVSRRVAVAQRSGSKLEEKNLAGRSSQSFWQVIAFVAWGMQPAPHKTFQLSFQYSQSIDAASWWYFVNVSSRLSSLLAKNDENMWVLKYYDVYPYIILYYNIYIYNYIYIDSQSPGKGLQNLFSRSISDSTPVARVPRPGFGVNGHHQIGGEDGWYPPHID